MLNEMLKAFGQDLKALANILNIFKALANTFNIEFQQNRMNVEANVEDVCQGLNAAQ